MARSKKPFSRKSRRPTTAKDRKSTALPKQSTKAPGKPVTRAAAGFEALDGKRHRAPFSRFALVDDARAVISRSGWQDVQHEHLSSQCRGLIAKLKKVCPNLIVERPLKAGEISGDIAITTKDFQSLFSIAAGAKEQPQVVWSDGTNELLVEIARMSMKTTDGLLVVSIPVFCEETGRQSILVTFATGSPKNPAGLIFATDRIPGGPPEIVEIWGEALIALAWTCILRVLSTLADVSGSDKDSNGLVPAGLATDSSGVNVLVMARHEMDRIIR